MSQWAIDFTNSSTHQEAKIYVRTSPLLQDLLEFEVVLAPIPLDDDKGKELVVNWQFYNNFSSNGTFVTDSNSMGVIQRQI